LLFFEIRASFLEGEQIRMRDMKDKM